MQEWRQHRRMTKRQPENQGSMEVSGRGKSEQRGAMQMACLRNC